MDSKRIIALIEKRKDELFALLGNLIKIDSQSFASHGNESEIAKYIHGLCQELGLESDMFSPLDLDGFESHPDYMPGRGLENRYNVVARYRGENDVDDLMLMAHSDTVQVGIFLNGNSIRSAARSATEGYLEEVPATTNTPLRRHCL